MVVSVFDSFYFDSFILGAYSEAVRFADRQRVSTDGRERLCSAQLVAFVVPFACIRANCV